MRKTMTDDELEKEFEMVNRLLAAGGTTREIGALRARRKRLLRPLAQKDMRGIIADLHNRGRIEIANVVERELRRSMGEDMRNPKRVAAGMANMARKTPEQRRAASSRAGKAAWVGHVRKSKPPTLR